MLRLVFSYTGTGALLSLWCRLSGDPPGTNVVRASCDQSPPAPTKLLHSLCSVATLWESRSSPLLLRALVEKLRLFFSYTGTGALLSLRWRLSRTPRGITFSDATRDLSLQVLSNPQRWICGRVAAFGTPLGS